MTKRISVNYLKNGNRPAQATDNVASTLEYETLVLTHIKPEISLGYDPRHGIREPGSPEYPYLSLTIELAQSDSEGHVMSNPVRTEYIAFSGHQLGRKALRELRECLMTLEQDLINRGIA